MKLVTLTALASIVTSSTAVQRACNDSKTTIDMQTCMVIALGEVDKELNRAYGKIMDSFKDKAGAEEKKKLVAEQRLWVKFRDAGADSVYQTYIEGTIRGAKALDHKIRATSGRTTELKRRYLNLFYPEITLQDLAGDWRGVIQTKNVLHIAADGTCSVEDAAGTKQTGKCTRDELNLTITDASGKKLLEEWVYVEPVTIGLDERLALEFLHGEGAPKEVFLRD